MQKAGLNGCFGCENSASGLTARVLTRRSDTQRGLAVALLQIGE
jgi:hypothetical protein